MDRDVRKLLCRVLKSWNGSDLVALGAYMVENARLNKLLSAAESQRNRYKEMLLLACSGCSLGEAV